MQNTSGDDPNAVMNWIWGVGNTTFIALLMFVPFINIITLFILGKKEDSIARFKKVPRRWAIAGAITYTLCITLVTGLVLEEIREVKNNPVYKLAVQKAKEHAGEYIGDSIDVGISRDLPETEKNNVVHFSFYIAGSRGDGTILVTAIKNPEGWKIVQMILETTSSDCPAPDQHKLLDELTVGEVSPATD